MARAQFETVVAAARRAGLTVTSQTMTVPIVSGGSAYIDVYAPSGQVGHLLNMYLEAPAPAGATTGTHQWTVGLNEPVVGNIIHGQAEAAHNQAPSFYAGQWTNVGSKRPGTDEAVLLSLSTMRFDNDTALRIGYHNLTDAAQAGPVVVQLTLWYEEVAV